MELTVVLEKANGLLTAATLKPDAEVSCYIRREKAFVSHFCLFPVLFIYVYSVVFFPEPVFLCGPEKASCIPKLQFCWPSGKGFEAEGAEEWNLSFLGSLSLFFCGAGNECGGSEVGGVWFLTMLSRMQFQVTFLLLIFWGEKVFSALSLKLTFLLFSVS